MSPVRAVVIHCSATGGVPALAEAAAKAARAMRIAEVLEAGPAEGASA